MLFGQILDRFFESLLHQVRRLAIFALQKVTVNVLRSRGRTMPKPAGHCLNVHSLTDQERRAGMPQAMEV